MNQSTHKLKSVLTGLLAAAMLITITLTACNNAIELEADGTVPETETLTTNPTGGLTIKLNGEESLSRALQVASDKAAINYYEVIFRLDNAPGEDDPDYTYTRLGWNKGETARLGVPPGDYVYDATDFDSGAGNTNPKNRNMAILLAGTNNAGTADDFTLLAMGYLTNVTDPSPVGAHGGSAATPYGVITATSESATFTLYGLEGWTSTNAADTSFRITYPTGTYDAVFAATPTYTGPGGTATAEEAAKEDPHNAHNFVTPSSGNIPYLELSNGGRVPYFRVPAAATDPDPFKAEYSFGILGSGSDGVKVDGSSGTTFLGSFLVFNNGTGTAVSNALTSAGTLTPVGAWTGTTASNAPEIFDNTSYITNAQNSSLVSANGKILMELTTTLKSGTGGLCVLQFDAKVSGFEAIETATSTAGVPNGLTWHLRGGVSNYLLDSIQGNGTATNTVGGGILLAMGDSNPQGILIVSHHHNEPAPSSP